MVLCGRNYHVFYYMLAGADDKEREALHLSKPEDYRYLSQVSRSQHAHCPLTSFSLCRTPRA